ncbi:unnamed protein product [Anisakis simplex]|uniref:G_PROTEIN_RECEP_F1_2 domain-containing protein n=1 Tax=Anisakis simplex TaxID=6269 RepID=A0A0M3K2F3_ANISI|nr:unnamed protein product [Anisakis simplex]
MVENIAMIAFFTFILVFGVSGNATVVIVYLTNKKLRKHFIATISLALFGTFGSMFYSISLYQYLIDENMTGITCNLIGFALSTLAVGTIHQLALLSYERYLATVHPFTLRRCTIQHKLLAVAFTVLCTLCTTIPPLIGWSRKIRSALQIILPSSPTFARWIDDDPQCPFLGNSSVRSNISFKRSVGSNTSVQQSIGHFSAQRDRTFQRRLTRIVLAAILTFMVSWTPYAILAVIWQFVGNEIPPRKYILTSVCFAKASVVWNPIIYGLNDRQFRVRFMMFARSSIRLGSLMGRDERRSEEHHHTFIERGTEL